MHSGGSGAPNTSSPPLLRERHETGIFVFVGALPDRLRPPCGSVDFCFNQNPRVDAMNAPPPPSPPASLVGFPIELGDMSLQQIYLALFCQSRGIMDEAKDVPATEWSIYRDRSVALERKAADVAQVMARFGDMNVACFRRIRPLNLSAFETNRLNPSGTALSTTVRGGSARSPENGNLHQLAPHPQLLLRRNRIRSVVELDLALNDDTVHPTIYAGRSSFRLRAFEQPEHSGPLGR